MGHEYYMRETLVEAKAALAAEEFPVGCVLALDGEIVARGHRKNSRTEVANEIDHAEVVTLRELLADRPGIDCGRITAYSTMEPCLMCYSTMLLSGIRHFVYGYEDMMGGGTNLPLFQLNPLYAEMQAQVQVEGVCCEMSALPCFNGFFVTFPTGRTACFPGTPLPNLHRI
jgi:tRNA(adenine34) deaminase